MRVELKALSTVARPSILNGILGAEPAQTTQPIDEDRKLRLIPKQGEGA